MAKRTVTFIWLPAPKVLGPGGRLGRVRWVHTVPHGTAVESSKLPYRGALKSQGRGRNV